jgi:hypothetical protein
MSAESLTPAIPAAARTREQRARDLFAAHDGDIKRRTVRLFAGLLIFQ